MEQVRELLEAISTHASLAGGDLALPFLTGLRIVISTHASLAGGDLP